MLLLQVVAANNAPEIAALQAYAAQEDTSLVFSDLVLNDVDAPDVLLGSTGPVSAAHSEHMLSAHARVSYA